MDEISDQLDHYRQQFQQAKGLYWIPIRHHSPACSHYLNELLDIHQPDILFIEGAIDFNQQLEALSHPETKPPIALYSANGFYPMCETSPEWQAIQWGIKNNKQIHFIDLPVKDKAWLAENKNLSRISYLHESNLQHSEFVKQLTKQTGCRNSDELWERQFELRPFDNANDFFLSVFSYCVAARLTYSEQALIDSGDIAREEHMRQQISRYIDPQKTSFVVTGGFHTSALLGVTNNKSQNNDNTNTQLEPTWLIRYSLDRLDANTGYSAGMEAPEFYQRLYQCRKEQALTTLSHEFVLDSLAILDNDEQFSTPINTAAKQVIYEQAMNLAKLRGHACPGLHDLKDALQSVLIKQEFTVYDFLLAQAHKALAGDELGQVSAKQPPLPLVNELYQHLKKAKFKLDSTTKVTTKLSLYKAKEQVQYRITLLNQCAYLELDFANKISGPDWLAGHHLQLLHEEWQYAWTPWVEAKLVDLSAYAADWTSLLAYKIRSHEQAVKEKTLVEGQQFFIQLVLMNCLDLAPQFWTHFNTLVQESTNSQQLSDLLFLLLRLKQNEPLTLQAHIAAFNTLTYEAWSQLMFSLPKINQHELDDALQLLMSIQEITREFEEYIAEDWKQSWSSRLQWLVEFGDFRPGLLYACRAILIELNTDDASHLLEDLARLFQRDAEEAYEALGAIIRIMPHWLMQQQKNSIITLLNDLMNQWSEERFLEALPELRLLFSHLDPKKVEQLSVHVCLLNQWNTALDVFSAEVNENEMMQAQSLQQKLLQHLNERGLEHWIKH